MNQSAHTPSNTMPLTPAQADLERLQLQAMEQRQQIHRSVTDLKFQVSQVRHDLDPANNARQHFVGTSLIAAGVCFVMGYGFGGFFTR
jgi:hypothetical protein